VVPELQCQAEFIRCGRRNTRTWPVGPNPNSRIEKNGPEIEVGDGVRGEDGRLISIDQPHDIIFQIAIAHNGQALPEALDVRPSVQPVTPQVLHVALHLQNLSQLRVLDVHQILGHQVHEILGVETRGVRVNPSLRRHYERDAISVELEQTRIIVQAGFSRSRGIVNHLIEDPVVANYGWCHGRGLL